MPLATRPNRASLGGSRWQVWGGIQRWRSTVLARTLYAPSAGARRPGSGGSDGDRGGAAELRRVRRPGTCFGPCWPDRHYRGRGPLVYTLEVAPADPTLRGIDCGPGRRPSDISARDTATAMWAAVLADAPGDEGATLLRRTAYWPPLYPGYLAIGQTIRSVLRPCCSLASVRRRDDSAHRCPGPGGGRPGCRAARGSLVATLPVFDRGGRLADGRDALGPVGRAGAPPRPTRRTRPTWGGGVRSAR